MVFRRDITRDAKSVGGDASCMQMALGFGERGAMDLFSLAFDEGKLNLLALRTPFPAATGPFFTTAQQRPRRRHKCSLHQPTMAVPWEVPGSRAETQEEE